MLFRFFQAEDGIRDIGVTGVQTCALPILILLDNDSRNEAAKNFGSIENTPVSSITMGVSTILSAKRIYLLAWGEEKAAMVKACVEGPITDTIPASYLQTHRNAHIAIDLSAASDRKSVV